MLISRRHVGSHCSPKRSRPRASSTSRRRIASLEGAEADAYAEARYSQQEAEAEFRWDLAAKILDGEMAIEDLPADMWAYTSFAIEDYVTQVGMGPLALRSNEKLAATDTKLAMLRRLWLEEVNALVQGEPTTDWTLPDEPLADYWVKTYQLDA